MRKGFYPKLAFNNLKKNGNTYFPYLLVCVCSVATYYTIQSISLNPGLLELPGASLLSSVLFMGCIIIAIFSAILLFYTNSFLIKRRKKELGLYSILGMEKRHIAAVLFFETIYVTVISLIIGLVIGILASKLLFMLLLKMLMIEIPIQFFISASAIIITSILFSVIFLFTLACNMWQIKIANPINLLQGARQGEKEPKTKWGLTVIGVAAILGGYYLALSVKSALDAVSLFFVAVILVIIGTYAVFTAGSITFLKGLKRNKALYYKPSNFISISGMIYRMKQNAVGLGNICILSTMVLVIVSTTVCLYVGKTDMLGNMSTRDVQIYSTVDNKEELQNFRQTIDQEAQHYGIEIADYLEYSTIGVTGTLLGDSIIKSIDQQEGTQCLIKLIPLEDYNRIYQSEKVLNDKEALLFFSGESPYGKRSLGVSGHVFEIDTEVNQLMDFDKSMAYPNQTIVLVVKDQTIIKQVYQDLYDNEFQQLDYEVSFNTEGSHQNEKAFVLSLQNKLKIIPNFGMFSQALMENEWYAIFGGFLFLGMFLGILFLMAMVLIIYYKQISEGYDDHDRFDIMQKVGMSKQEVKSTINKQILMVFFLPLIVAIFHIAFAFKMITKIMSAFYMTNITLFLICTIIAVSIFALFYILVYRLTARAYYKLVQ